MRIARIYRRYRRRSDLRLHSRIKRFISHYKETDCLIERNNPRENRVHYRHITGCKSFINLNVDQNTQYRVCRGIYNSQNYKQYIQYDQCCRERHNASDCSAVYPCGCTGSYCCNNKKYKQNPCNCTVYYRHYKFPDSRVFNAFVFQRDLICKITVEIISCKRDKCKPCVLSSHTFSDGVQADRMKNVTCKRNSDNHCKCNQINSQKHGDRRISSRSMSDRVIIFILITISVIHKLPPIRPLLPEPLLS